MTKVIFGLACAAFAVAALALPARAAVAPSREHLETEREKTMRRVERLLDQELVRRRLARMGMSREEIEARLAKLEDRELEELADRLDNMAVGRGALGVVIAVLVVAALVLLVIFLAERT